MRPIRNPAKPPLRRRAPRLPGQSRALPGASRSPPGPAGPDAPARPLSSRCLGADTWARLRRPQARSARATSHPPPHRPPQGSNRLRLGSGRSAGQEGAQSDSDLGGRLGCCLVGRSVHVCVPVCTRGSSCVREALSSVAWPGGLRVFIWGGGFCWSRRGWDAQGISALSARPPALVLGARSQVSPSHQASSRPPLF